MRHRIPLLRLRPARALLLVPLLAAAPLVAAPLAGQEGVPTAAEVEAARTAPLFSTHEPLVLTLETDVERLKDERAEDRTPQGATLIYTEPDGREVRLSLEVEPRGNFRREKRNCSFPPVRLDFDADDPALPGTAFEGQNRLKLVMPCRENRDAYQRYIYREYAVYRMMNALHDVSFRVRLLDLTYRDDEGGEDPLRVHAFVIEDDDRMAARHEAAKVELEQLHPLAPGGEYVTLVALFEFMVGNTDWDPTIFHNVELVRTADGRYLTVPYDFDFAGAVDARYASPDPSFPIDDVRERLYRGFCLETVDLDRLIARFVERKDAMWAAVREIPWWDEGDREGFLRYVGEFYDIVGTDWRREREIESVCRDWRG